MRAWKMEVDQNIQRQLARLVMKPPTIGPTATATRGIAR
jgi:hypothetical protein